MNRFIIYSILILVYVGGLLFIYLPQPLIVENGSLDYFSCALVNCSSLLVQLLEQSQTSRCVFYDLDEPALVEAVSKHAKTLLFDHNPLHHSNITLIGSKGLMHHKFCVVDNQYVLTGTWNPTVRGTYYNDNVVILVNSKSVANSYLSEFEHLSEGGNSEITRVLLGNLTVETLFCPECEQRIVKELEQAQRSIDILAFYFSSEGIATALLDAHERNVTIRVVFEKTRISKYSVLDILSDVGIEVYTDGNKYVMHEKVFLIDNQTIIVGSYNPTKGATTVNEENVLIIKNDENGLEFFNEEFERIRKDAVLV